MVFDRGHLFFPMDDTPHAHKAHQRSKSKNKNKKKGDKVSLKDQNEKQRRLNNPKAFISSSAGGTSADKRTRRNAEKEQRKLHVPLQDHTPTEPAPYVVAVMGPPGSGKSTVIRSLVKRYTRQNLADIHGPITVISGKKKRLTFIECRNDINSLIDTAKIADMVLLLINAERGFEMETFEFLNLLQVHGFPKILGVLTHLDGFKDNKRLKTVKKDLKQRFWTELYQGAKLFYLSGLQHGKYLQNEILNLSRFIAVAKLRPLIWKNSHPYALVDRVEDLTDPESLLKNPKTDRKVAFYGYLRGIPLRPEVHKIHIPGAGDFSIAECVVLEDPCPLPNTEKALKTLNDKQRMIYAPMSDLSGIRYDQDTVYIDLPTANNKLKKRVDEDGGEGDEGESMLQELTKKDVRLEKQLDDSEFLLFKDAAPVLIEPAESESESDSILEVSDYSSDESESKSDNDDFEPVVVRAEGNGGADDDVYRAKESDSDDDLLESLRRQKIENSDDAIGDDDDSGFEDLEDDEADSHDYDKVDLEALAKEKEALKKQFDRDFDDDRLEDEKEEKGKPQLDDTDTDNYFETMKKSFEAQRLANEQALQDLDPKLKTVVQGIQAGSYVKIVMDSVPCELITLFDPTRFIILGGLHAHELAFGYCQARLKRHRWFGKVLKTNEPLVMSIGWRRFQTCPVFSLKDATRNRMLKYTPEHMHCNASFYGPITAQNTGLCAFRSLQEGQSAFRVSATGTILEFDQSVNVVKKLKLVGHPIEIHKNTCFIKDMFTSSLEVNKFVGASIRTVSGIRGQVKRAQDDNGQFRASFEDKLLMSDIVFLRTWYPVPVRQFYNPVTSLLERDGEWSGMRLNGQVRHEMQVPSVASHPDHHYRPITERPEHRRFNPLQIPGSLQRSLPYSSKPKLTHKATTTPRYTDTRKSVMLEPNEKSRLHLLQQVSTVHKDKVAKRKAKVAVSRAKHLAEVKAVEALKETKLKRKIVEQVVKRDRKRLREH